MNEPEFNWTCQLIESLAKAAYQAGYEEAIEKKAMNTNQFVLTPAHKLQLKKELRLLTKKH